MLDDNYAVPCPECDRVFTCEFFMQSHQMSHWPQPHGFVDLDVLDDCGDYGYSDKDPAHLSRYLSVDVCDHDEETVWEDEDTVQWRCRNCTAEGWDPR